MARKSNGSTWLRTHLLEPRGSVGSGEVCVDQGSGLGLRAGHELAIEVVGRLDRRVAHVRRDRLRVDAGGDEDRRERVAGLVEADGLQASPLPRPPGPSPEGRRLERRFRGRAEDETDVSSLARLVFDEAVAERADDRDDSPAGPALRLDFDVFLVVVCALNPQDAGCQVDVFPGSAMSSPRRSPA